MDEPRLSVCVFAQTDGENNYQLEASIRDDGNLQLLGIDDGPLVKEQKMGTDMYAYFFTVPSEQKDAMLLQLLRDRYRDRDFELTIWLQSRGIPFDFWSMFRFS